MGALIIGITLFFAWTRLQNIRLERDISRLERVKRELEIENRRLQLSWARLTDPSRLTTIGRERFQLEAVTPQQIIRIREN